MRRSVGRPLLDLDRPAGRHRGQLGLHQQPVADQPEHRLGADLPEPEPVAAARLQRAPTSPTSTVHTTITKPESDSAPESGRQPGHRRRRAPVPGTAPRSLSTSACRAGSAAARTSTTTRTAAAATATWGLPASSDQPRTQQPGPAPRGGDPAFGRRAVRGPRSRPAAGRRCGLRSGRVTAVMVGPPYRARTAPIAKRYRSVTDRARFRRG